MLGFNGGKMQQMADTVIHFKVDDMQISEDFQMLIVHILTEANQD